MAHPMEARVERTEITLEQGDLTRFSADAIVNAANTGLRGGGGVDGAIHAAAGPQLMAELRERYHGTATGTAVITGAGSLPAQHVIHAVGPVWRGGTAGEAKQLASAYRSALDRAAEAGAATVAFPAISCGIYGYPHDLAALVAMRGIRGWLTDHPDSGIERITFVLRGDHMLQVFRQALEAVETEPQSAASQDNVHG